MLRLNQIAASNTAAGQVTNLISNDVARFDLVFIFLHYIWIMPFQVRYLFLKSITISIKQTVEINEYRTESLNF